MTHFKSIQKWQQETHQYTVHEIGERYSQIHGNKKLIKFQLPPKPRYRCKLYHPTQQTEKNWNTKWPTIFIARQHTDARYWYSKSVRLFVRLFVRNVPVSYENSLTYRHSFFTIR